MCSSDLLAKKPDERFQHAAEFAAALRSLVDDPAVEQAMSAIPDSAVGFVETVPAIQSVPRVQTPMPQSVAKRAPPAPTEPAPEPAPESERRSRSARERDAEVEERAGVPRRRPGRRVARPGAGRHLLARERVARHQAAERVVEADEVGVLATADAHGHLTADAERQIAARQLAAAVPLGVTAALVGFLVAGAFEWNFGDEELLYHLYALVGFAWAAGQWDADA